MSGLHLAAKEGHLSVVMELLNRGANCAARTRVRDMPFFFFHFGVYLRLVEKDKNVSR